jgi:hypothetical protein
MKFSRFHVPRLRRFFRAIEPAKKMVLSLVRTLSHPFSCALAESHAAIATWSYRPINVGGILGSTTNAEVGEPVVSRVPVDVVDLLICRKPEECFSHESVYLRAKPLSAPAHTHLHVFLLAAAAFVFLELEPTPGSRPLSGAWHGKHFSTFRDLIAPIPPRYVEFLHTQRSTTCDKPARSFWDVCAMHFQATKS